MVELGLLCDHKVSVEATGLGTHVKACNDWVLVLVAHLLLLQHQGTLGIVTASIGICAFFPF